ncbi:MAG: hypothetical protein ACF8PN_15735 [Phycisphaerales bacterium]
MRRIRRSQLNGASPRIAFGVAIMALSFTPARAQYATDFETLNASPGGEILTGQDGYYLPNVNGSQHAFAYSYAGNALGIPDNPRGGAVFVGGSGPGGGFFLRAQRNLNWNPGYYIITYDTCVRYDGGLPATQNVGSLSSQDSTVSATFIALSTWTDPNTADRWDADYIWYDSVGTQLTEKAPDPGFQNLSTNEWYERGTLIDLISNRILSVWVTNLSTQETVTYDPPDRFLRGGAAGAPAPTAYRLFVGGSGAGNIIAFDNVSITRYQFVNLPLLEMSGDCPGRGRFQVSHATPNGTVAFVYGFQAEDFIIPSGPCAGTELGIRNPILGGVARADANGVAVIEANLPASACDRVFVQALDVTTCTSSGVALVNFGRLDGKQCEYKIECLVVNNDCAGAVRALVKAIDPTARVVYIGDGCEGPIECDPGPLHKKITVQYSVNGGEPETCSMHLKLLFTGCVRPTPVPFTEAAGGVVGPCVDW